MFRSTFVTLTSIVLLAGCPLIPMNTDPGDGTDTTSTTDTTDETDSPCTTTETTTDTNPTTGDTGTTIPKKPEPFTLLGRWDLQEYQSDETIPSTLPNAVLFEDDGSITVLGDCNTCFGTYQYGVDAVRITILGCTRIACQDTEEGDFLSALEASWQWGGKDDTLLVSYEGDGPGDGGTMELTRAARE